MYKPKVLLVTKTKSKPLPYMERIKKYYIGLGYSTPYRWAKLDSIPFTSLKKPLSKARIGIITTASLFNPANGDQGPGALYNGKAKFFTTYAKPISPFPDVRISHIAIDRTHTTATDMASYFPLSALFRLYKAQYIGSISPNLYGLPTNRSHRVTIEQDCPKLVSLCKEDRVDAVVLVPNCPICHQSTALAASQLETAGIPSVLMGSALDIVEHVGVPRLLFNDFPLGNAAGLPQNIVSQDLIAKMAVDLLYYAIEPRTTVKSPLTWSGESDWKKDYSNIDQLSASEVKRLRVEFDKVKKDAKAIKAL
ncbi:MAG: glycine reductase [Rhodobacteraceae bacterium]|nr:glycine reductase [Paracoccaceae bacterium]